MLSPLRSQGAALLALVLSTILFGSQPLLGQTFNVIHTFNGTDGAGPIGSLAIDGTGNLYGASTAGGAHGQGTVFMLRQTDGAWALTTLHSFPGYAGDGISPQGGPTVTASGIVYGTTNEGGLGFGTVYAVATPTGLVTSVRQPRNETIIHSFTGFDGWGPDSTNLLLDRVGNLYGVTPNGGRYGKGVVYELSPSGGGWMENVLYSFCIVDCLDGSNPYAGPIFDSAGNLYGTTIGFGIGGCCGIVYELFNSGSGWTEQLLHFFDLPSVEGGNPYGSVIFDEAGNLYGTTSSYGPNNGGTVFELTPSGSGWNFSVLYAFTGSDESPTGPLGGLLLDRLGNLWGTTNQQGTQGHGNIFKLTPSQGGWIYADVYDFTGGNDGANPTGSLTADASGNIYGTASLGGAHGDGVVFELTP